MKICIPDHAFQLCNGVHTSILHTYTVFAIIEMNSLFLFIMQVHNLRLAIFLLGDRNLE